MKPNIEQVQRYVATVAIGPTTLRKMRGTKGKLDKARRFLAEINLGMLSHQNFSSLLDKHTNSLAEIFVYNEVEKNWGAARKVVNIFFRDATYNVWLRTQYALEKIEPSLECPLDKFSMTAIKREAELQLTVPAVSQLSPADSAKFQCAALKIAAKLNQHRVHIDLAFWLESKPQMTSK